jgi:hypothetical protein
LPESVFSTANRCHSREYLGQVEFDCGRTALHGSVNTGKRADLVLLIGNPLDAIENSRKVRAVLFRGEYLDRTRLDALLQRAEATAKRPLGADAGR